MILVLWVIQIIHICEYGNTSEIEICPVQHPPVNCCLYRNRPELTLYIPGKGTNNNNSGDFTTNISFDAVQSIFIDLNQTI